MDLLQSRLNVNIERVCILGHPPEHAWPPPLLGGDHCVGGACMCKQWQCELWRTEAAVPLGGKLVLPFPPTHLNNELVERVSCMCARL